MFKLHARKELYLTMCFIILLVRGCIKPMGLVFFHFYLRDPPPPGPLVEQNLMHPVRD